MPAFACLLAITVVVGLTLSLGTSTIKRVDRYSVEHLMPGHASVFAYVGINTAGEPAVALEPRDPHLARETHYVWGPFSRLFATVLLIGLCGYAYFRRRSTGAVVGWLVGYGIANVGALAFQHIVRRPDILLGTQHLTYSVSDYAASFPSGYSVRVVFGALVVCALWPRLVVLAAPFALFVLTAIVAGGSHLPTDVAAGAAVAVASYILGQGVGRAAAAKLSSTSAGRAALRTGEVERPAPHDDPGEDKHDHEPSPVRGDQERPHSIAR